MLAEEALRLDVDLADGFVGETFAVDNASPFADAEFLEGEFEDLDLLDGPAWGESVVPEAFGFMVGADLFPLGFVHNGGNFDCELKQ